MTLGPALQVVRQSNVAVVSIDGEIDISNVDLLRPQLGAALENSDFGLVVDLSSTGYLDSTGLSLLFALNEQLGNRQQILVVVVPDDAIIERVITAVNLPAIMPVFTTVDDAIAQITQSHAG